MRPRLGANRGKAKAKGGRFANPASAIASGTNQSESRFALDQLVSPATPEGFVPRPAGGPFLDPIGPIMIRRDLGPLAFGLRIEKRHCNSKDMAHGGMLATFADLALGIGGFTLAGVKGFFTTISLNSDYLAPALLGTWLQCEPVLLRKTRTLVFAQGVCMADGKPVLRASGVFALPKDPPPQPIGG